MNISPVSFQAKALIKPEFSKTDENYINKKARYFDDNPNNHIVVTAPKWKWSNDVNSYITTFNLDYYKNTKYQTSVSINTKVDEAFLNEESVKKYFKTAFKNLKTAVKLVEAKELVDKVVKGNKKGDK